MMLLLEHWKPVVGFEDWYEVSNVGTVRRLKPGFSTRPGKQLIPQMNEGGYLRVSFSIASREQKKRVHCLVAEAFIGARPKGMQVNHKDVNKKNNRVSNLEYVTPRDNVLHAIEMGIAFPPPAASRIRKYKLSREQVEEVWNAPPTVTGKTLSQRFGVSESLISGIRNRKVSVPASDA